MDIKTMTVEQLKAFVYDQMVILENIQTNMRIANEEIQLRTKKEPNPTKE